MKLKLITGKGGVGKSAVTASLATALAELKYKVGIIELGEARMADFFKSSLPTYAGHAVNPYISLFNLESPACFEEYASLHLPKRALALLKNRWVNHFIDAAPGLNEILLLGKIYSLSNENCFDFLLIDAPATGHTISLCDAPRIAMKALKHGPLRTMVEKVWDLFHDSKKTSFLLVTQLEHFIVHETVELHQHLTKKLELSFDNVIINGKMNGENIPTEEIPKESPKEAALIVGCLKTYQEKIKRQQTLFSELKKTFPKTIPQLFWGEHLIEECDLRLKLTKDLKPWVLQNYSKKSA
ncbi:MAG: hypothetical protein A2W61_00585 [Deltaproteobacteria bacterium RIFCSPLOWO2_01_44_7]|nr:MAG: hypothetical protein A2712_08860 [Deltaproteobacteria bacterium RIFCSPHIGHO2_01_FULL_43_49]OGQ14553.1 MAG: hypothetical protein A3D22_08140 [Deltaproteobacteria bacterium RIFCSPHIGHO2_02_FULL_44_53]OGQ27939.1 MAG: hypothetical protein A3D98_06850 [Deltaproteobacteria bacterium RIFCSPHIGHO2_12_FULL_44_21]OGQ31151.1 MAG: hypothetical protein A2979_06900 [Deltaproteobacteria bacterium RIFCSPLOWO2_01_FULL_45_74]OGQ37573.1 MAG: hypothetical protein A2W61_00585 [Deltaproteobacteria bacterium 